MKRVALLLLLALACCPAQAGNPRNLDIPFLPVPTTRIVAPGTQLDRIAARHGLLGFSVVGVRDHETLVSYHSGTANVADGRLVTERTAYRIASISKVVAAVALMQQWEKGRFGLDDDVSDALGYRVRNPRYPSTPITYRQLLSHTSGLRDSKKYFNFMTRTFSGAPPPLSSLKPDFMPHAPGTGYQYSNLGFGFIGTLVEKHSGQRFGDYARRRILKPLGMQASFTAADLPAIDRLATLYRWENGAWQAQVDDFRGRRPASLVPPDYKPGRNGIVFAPHGGLRVSALDLSKLLRALMSGGLYGNARILREKTVNLMSEPQWLVSTGREFYATGLGLHLVSPYGNNGSLWIGHSGVASGLQSDMYHQFEGRYGVIFATNGIKPQPESPAPTSRFRDQIAKTVLASMRRLTEEGQ